MVVTHGGYTWWLHMVVTHMVVTQQDTMVSKSTRRGWGGGGEVGSSAQCKHDPRGTLPGTVRLREVRNQPLVLCRACEGVPLGTVRGEHGSHTYDKSTRLLEEGGWLHL